MFDFYNPDLRILNFTHIDFDGAASAVVIKNYYKNVQTEVINYGKEQEAYDKMTKNMGAFDAVVFTDFCPVNIKQLQKIGKPILVLDHHETAKQFADPQNGVYIKTEVCGAMLAFKYYSVKKDLSHLKDLINIANDYDLFTLKDNRSMCFNALFWEMGFRWFVRRFMTGNTSLYAEEKDYIRWYKVDEQKWYDNLELVDIPVKNLKGCFYETEKYLAEMSARLRLDGYDFQIIKHGTALSVRSNSDALDLTKVCQFIGKGGGHPKAVGIPVPFGENIEELTKKICYGIEHVLNYGAEMPF